tara:strand:- start:1037 stop:1744 length:708 start_codon:yes stop_codon:yes gene_type:complete
MKNLLLIDDDKELVFLLVEYLTLQGFTIETAFDGEQGLSKFLSKDYDLILLDEIMPRMTGFEMLKLLRQKSDTPVLMLTTKEGETDKLLGLDMGANDYLAKPFSDRELLARIRAIFRRIHYKTANTNNKISHLDIDLYPAQQQALCQERTIELTSSELLLLENFLKHPGELLAKSELSEQVLGKQLQPFDRSIDMHLSNLRRKLPTRIDGQARLKNFRGRGYMWLDTKISIPEPN